MAKSRHSGKSSHRLSDNPREKLYAKEWKKLHRDAPAGRGILDYLLADDNNRPRDEVTDRDAEVAATVIQWLGSPVGQNWLKATQAKADKLPE